METVFIGLAGCGTVGGGLAKIIQDNGDWIAQRIGRKLQIKTVLVRDLKKQRAVQFGAETEFTTDSQVILNDQKIHIVVELMGGIDAAFDFVSQAIAKGKSVVTANKALLAEKGNILFEMAEKKGVGLYYEASVCGGIPIVQTLKESLAGDKILSLTGILNGTANYILSEMSQRGIDFSVALKEAQEKGFAEADPTLDIEGMDAAHKLVVLIRLAYGKHYPLQRLRVQGISRVKATDIAFAEDFGYQIKLLGQVKICNSSLQAGVFPTLVPFEHILAKVMGPFNAVWLEGQAVGQIMLYGQGAGALPTGNAVLADVMALAKKEARPNNTGFVLPVLPEADFSVCSGSECAHYFRFTVKDKPGVLSMLSGILGEERISIARVVQKVADADGVPIVFLTHIASEEAVERALKKLDSCDFISAPTVHYRIL